MSADKKKPSAKATDFGGLYIAGDRIPTPEAVEENSEAAWALFNELSTKQEARYADTAPAGLTGPGSLATLLSKGDQRYADTEPAGLLAHQTAGQPPEPALTVDAVLLEARRNNRVCPLPLQWQALYDQMRAAANGRRVPTPPMTSAAAWHGTPSLSKRMVLREHVEWAQGQGYLQPLHAFLSSLREDEWHHMGE